MNQKEERHLVDLPDEIRKLIIEPGYAINPRNYVTTPKGHQPSMLFINIWADDTKYFMDLDGYTIHEVDRNDFIGYIDNIISVIRREIVLYKYRVIFIEDCLISDKIFNDLSMLAGHYHYTAIIKIRSSIKQRNVDMTDNIFIMAIKSTNKPGKYIFSIKFSNQTVDLVSGSVKRLMNYITQQIILSKPDGDLRQIMFIIDGDSDVIELWEHEWGTILKSFSQYNINWSRANTKCIHLDKYYDSDDDTVTIPSMII